MRDGGSSLAAGARRVPPSARRNAVVAVVVVRAFLMAPFVRGRSALAGIGLGIVPSFPATTAVGQTFPGRLTITNCSTPPDSTTPGTVSNIVLVPACSNTNLGCSGGVEAGVFDIDPASTAATGCPGVTSFAISPSAPGVFSLTPNAPLVLDVGQACSIDFTARTLRVPSVDTVLGLPGTQTNQVASGTLTIGTLGSPGVGSDVATVTPASTALSTVAIPSTAPGDTGAFEVPLDLPALSLGTAAVVARCGSTLLATTIEVALGTNVEPSAFTLAVLLFIVLVSIGLVRRRVA